MTSPEEKITFGTPNAPLDKNINTKITIKEAPKKKARKKKICGYTEVTQGYRWICELRPKHKEEHKLVPHKRIIPGLEIRKKETARLF